MIAAVVLAAGQSRRMGQAKLLLPWGITTVIGQVVGSLAQGGVSEIVVVTGGAADQVEQALHGLPARLAFNPRYRQDEMAWSLQVGLAALGPAVTATLVALGDQPQIEPEVVAGVIAAHAATGAALVIPSYQMRRGHPWLLARSLWPAVFALEPGQTLRHLLQASAGQIVYHTVDRPSILRDLDTPQDYARERPENGEAGKRGREEK